MFIFFKTGSISLSFVLSSYALSVLAINQGFDSLCFLRKAMHATLRQNYFLTYLSPLLVLQRPASICSGRRRAAMIRRRHRKRSRLKSVPKSSFADKKASRDRRRERATILRPCPSGIRRKAPPSGM